MDRAIDYLEEAAHSAENSGARLHAASSYEDLARAYHFARRSGLVEGEAEEVYHRKELYNLDKAEELNWAEIQQLFGVKPNDLRGLTETLTFDSWHPVFATMAKVYRDRAHEIIISKMVKEPSENEQIHKVAQYSALSVLFAVLYSTTSTTLDRILADLGGWLSGLHDSGKVEMAISDMKIWLHHAGVKTCPPLEKYVDAMVFLDTFVKWPKGEDYWTVISP